MDYVVPFDQLGIATPGPWTNASPQAGIKGSIVNANVFPAVQQEILNVQDEASLTRDGTNFAQLLQAIRSGKLTFFQDTGTADALVITPRTSFPSLGAGLALSVLKGQAPNATKTPELSVGGLVQTIVKEDGSALAIGDLPGNCLFSVRSDGTNFRVVGLRRSDTLLTNYGATAQGGLAKDGSSNFLLSLIQNLTADTRTAPVAADIIALGRAADGAMVGVSATKLATYILSNIVATNTFQQIEPNPVIYVNASTGSDSTGSGAQSAPFQTLSKALAYGTSAYNFTSGTLTIYLAAGTYATPVNIPVGSGVISIIGDTSSNGANRGNYVISGQGVASGGVLIARSNVQLSGLTIQNTGTICSTLSAAGGSTVLVTNVTFTTTSALGSNFFHAEANGGTLTFAGGIQVNGSGAGMLRSVSLGQFTIFSDLTILGSATFSTATAYALYGALILVEGGATITATGTVTGSHYNVDGGQIRALNGGGATTFPGSTAGTVSNGGIYS